MPKPPSTQHTLATYETAGGDQAFLRYEFLTVKEEQPDFSSAVVDRHLAEAVLVTAEDAALVQWLLATRDLEGTLTDLLDTYGVSFRYPASLSTSSTVNLPRLPNRPLRSVPGPGPDRSDLPDAA